MPKKNVENEVNTQETNEKEVEKESALKSENEQLKTELSQLKEIVEMLVKKQTQESENKAVKNEETEDLFVDIPLNKRIKVISLTHGGLNLKIDNKSPLRFNDFGDVRNPSYEDIQSIISNHPNLARKGAFFICDKDVVKNEYLEVYYKNVIDRNKMENIMSLSKDEIKEIFNNITDVQKESILGFIVAGIANEEEKYSDLNKIKVINDIAKVDLISLAQNYDIK